MPAPNIATSKVDSGLEGVGEVPWGTHICHVYSAAAELSDALAAYFAAGLQNGERCVWIASRPLDESRARAVMAQAVPSLAHYEARLQFQILCPWEFAPDNRRSDPEWLAANWLAREEDALADGFAGLRVSVNATAFDELEPQELAGYEASLHRSLTDRRMLVLCSYPLARCASPDAIDGALCHDYAILHDGKRWKALESATALVSACAVRRETRESHARIRSPIRRRSRRLSTAIDVNERLGRLQEVTAALSKVHQADHLPDAITRIVCPAVGASSVLATGVELEDGAVRVLCGTGGFSDEDAYLDIATRLDNATWLHDREDVAKVFEPPPLGACSVAAIPFDIGARRPGCIVFGFKRGRSFRPASRALIADVAHQVGLTVERLLLLDHLERQHRRLERESRAKDDFLAMLGHELRNPLASIRTAVTLLGKDGADAERIARVMRIIERRTEHMARLVDGILEVSRMQRGKVELRLETTDLRDMIAEGIDEYRAQLSEHGLMLVADLPDEPVHVWADRMRLVQVIDNLVANAVRYTPSGGRVTVRLAKIAGHACLSVEDTGVGIDPCELPYVFEAFEQAAAADARGLGLGLALVRGIVECHGGQVSAESPGKGRGSRFRVRLPLSDAGCAARPTTPPIAPDVTPRRVLVVEDDTDMCDLLREVLESSGHTLSVAYDGEQALTVARESRPEVVLCDIGLPGEMDGYDVAAALRSDPTTPTLIVGLSGFGHQGDVRESPFDVHLTKPVDMDTLEDVLERAPQLGRSQSAAEEE